MLIRSSGRKNFSTCGGSIEGVGPYAGARFGGTLASAIAAVPPLLQDCNSSIGIRLDPVNPKKPCIRGFEHLR
jgi:hypothetical protein